MKYIIVNIRNLFQKNKMVSGMLLIGMLISSYVILFCVGMLYQVFEKKLTDLNPLDFLQIQCVDTKEQCVRWSELKQFFKQLDKNVNTSIDLVSMKASLEDKPSEDSFDEFSFDYLLSAAGEPAYCDLTSYLRSMGALYDGRYYTEEEFNNREAVALSNGYEYINNGNQAKYTKKYEADATGDTYLIDGVTFKRIGSAFFWTTPVFPVTLLKEEARIDYFGFEFKDYSLTEKRYNSICRLVDSCFDGRAEVANVKFPKLDNNYYYLVGGVVVFLGLITAIILSMLYEFILMQQWDMYRVYVLCGRTKRSIAMDFIVQCLLLVSVIYLLVALLYQYGILNLLDNKLFYFREVYTIKSYLLIYLGLLFGNLMISGVIVLKKLKQKSSIVSS